MLNPAAAAAAAAAARHPVSNPIKLFYNHQNILQLHKYATSLFLYANIFSKQKGRGQGSIFSKKQGGGQGSGEHGHNIK